MATIRIYYDPATGKLILPDGEKTKAKRKETITWQPDSRVFISNIYPKTSLPSPFFSKLPHRDGSSDNWKAVIAHDAEYDSEYNYSISWLLDGKGDMKVHDPIISIKPDYSFNIYQIIVGVVTTLAVLLGISFFLSGKNKKYK